jgi:type IV secretory pathway protease TraF
LPATFHLLKRVVAIEGDRVCTAGHRYVINGQLLSLIATHDRAGRPLPDPYPYCDLVRPRTVFVAGDGPASLDSRYFGPVSVQALTTAQPLWTSS